VVIFKERAARARPGATKPDKPDSKITNA